MRVQVVNLRRLDPDDPPPRGQLVNAEVVVTVRRRLVRCRMFGHRAVVDGDPDRRWVVCARCGVRPFPQGVLDPARHPVGARYRGPFTGPLMTGTGMLPGVWQPHQRGAVGVQVVAGGGVPGLSVGVTVGAATSLHPLAWHLRFGWFGGLFGYTLKIGAGWARRVNPSAGSKRVCSVTLTGGVLSWRWWMPQLDPAGTRWWRAGHLTVSPVTWVWGPHTQDREPVDHPQVVRTVRMPERDYPTRLQLVRVTTGRPRGRRRVVSWVVRWDTLGPGVPTVGPLRGRVRTGVVTVSEASVVAGTWAASAAALAAAELTERRTGAGWEPTGVCVVGL